MKKFSPENGPLPAPLVDIHMPGKRFNPTRDFEQKYRIRMAELLNIFPVEDNPDIYYPPETAKEFLTERYAGAPKFHQNVMRRMWGSLNELEKRDYIMNGKKLYDSQMGHAIWTPLSFVEGEESPTAFFIEGAPGTGKTLTLSFIMNAIREEIDATLGEFGMDETQKIAFLTVRQQHLPGKIRGGDMGLRHVLRLPPFEMDVKQAGSIYTALNKAEPSVGKAMTRKEWVELMMQDINEKNVDQLIAPFAKKGQWKPDTIDVVRMILLRRALHISGPDQTMQLLTFDKLPKKVEMQGYAGDAASAIPEGYPVHAKSTLGMGETPLSEARIALLPMSTFTSSVQFEKLSEELLQYVRAVVLDEAQSREASMFQARAEEAGAEEMPIVVAAGSQWYGRESWERRSPSHSWLESIRRGVLRDLGVRIFPGENQDHYPSETKEALAQLVAEHMRNLPFFDSLDLPQPGRSNTLMLVHTKLVGKVVKMLEAAYAKGKRTNGEIKAYAGTQDAPEALQAWFAVPGDRVLVSSPAIMKLAWDLPAIRQLIIGTKASPDALFHEVGRLAHGRVKVNANDRLLLTMQQFSNSNLGVTPFEVFAHGQEIPSDGHPWVSGQAIMSSAAYKRDKKKVAGKEKEFGAVQVPAAGKAGADAIKKKEGTPLVFSPKEKELPFRPRILRESSNGEVGEYEVERWADEFRARDVFVAYKASLVTIAKEAVASGKDPRQAVKTKIASLRERQMRFANQPS